MTAPTPDTTSQISIFDVDFSSSYLNVLLQGNKWGGPLGSAATVYYSFPTSRSDAYWSQDFINGYGIFDPTTDGTPDYVSLMPLSSSQQNGITLALNAWASVANLDFIKVNETPDAVGDIRFGFTLDGAMSPEIYAYSYSVDPIWYDYSDIIPYTRSGDIWFNKNQPDQTGNNFSTGAMGYFVGLHEIGHALGIDHSFSEEDGDLGLPTNIEYVQYTVMSYSDLPNSHFDGFNEYYPTTPMLYDILAIQHLYGANNSYNADDTVYEFSSSQRYYQTIWDAGGNDTIKYASSIGGVINLEEGSFSQLGKAFKVGVNNNTIQKDNIAIAFNVVIENAIGGSGSDRITGNSADNRLEGAAGDDTLDGGIGADTLIGGKGNDTYIVDDEDDVVVESLNEGTDLVKASVSYTLSDNVENLTLTDGTANGGTGALNGTGNALANTITGNAGNNILDGGAGVDKLIGGLGNDTYIVDLVRSGTAPANYKVALQDTITETAVAGSGTDTVQLRLLSGTDFTVMANATTIMLGANLENLDASLTGTIKLNLNGNALANTLTGNDADNILDGGAGVDTLIGGLGNDTYILDLKVSGTGVSANVNTFDDSITETNGIDTIKLRGTAILTNAATLSLDGQWADIELLDASATASTKLNLIGNNLDNTLIGNAAANILIGGTGDDTLNGGAGADAMTGGDGDDTYIVDNIADQVIENDGEGVDWVKTSVSYALSNYVEFLELIGTSAINGTGNDLTNFIKGNTSNNILDGGAGGDIIIGGKGNDTYIVDDEDDVVVESLNEGTDLVKASVSYTLSDNVENLTLTDGSANGGTNPLEGTGNALANTITGNAGNNILDGGAGVDKLIGGLGNDTYIVDLVRSGTAPANYKVALQDTITETAVAGSGTDTVQLRLLSGTDFTVMANATTIMLGANLENLDASLTGTTKLNLNGNALANTLTGNDADNILDGGAGVDTLIGGLGNDTYILDLKVSGTGVSANVNTFDDSITETNGITNGSDTIKLRGTATLTTATTLTLDGDWADIENIDASATGKTKLNLTGNSLNNTLTGNAAANILTGGDGNDTYVVNNIDDSVVEEENEGTDLIQASITYTLGDNVENLELLGTAAINGTGNDEANIITGNAGNNILDGKGGIDTLRGGKGNDTYIVDDEDDKIIENLNEGIDLVKASVSYTLSDNVENLTLTDGTANGGTGALNGTGNALANTITGNAGNNILDGGAGVDKLIGGLGNDTYIVDLVRSGTAPANYKVALQDTITETAVAGSGTDTVQLRLLSGTDFTVMANATTITLGANLEHLDASLTGTTKLNLNGNALANTLTGNDADNILDGGTGVDTLIGGLGNDTYILDLKVSGTGGSANVNTFDDSITESNGTSNGIDTVKLRGTAILTNAATLSLDDQWADIEVLDASATGSTKLNLIGNNLGNALIGNAAANILTGGTGKDTLNGGAGADTMIGGDGNDIYIVDNIGDEVIELPDVINNIQAENGDSRDAHLSSDGKFVIFSSTATNLLPNNTDFLGIREVFLKNLQTGEILSITNNAQGEQANGNSGAILSKNGNFALITSSASNLIANDTNNVEDVFIKNLLTGEIKLVSESALGVQGNNSSWGMGISADGRYVLLQSGATNLGPEGLSDRGLYIKDTQTGSVVKLINGDYNIESIVLSPNGKYLLLEASDSSLTKDYTRSSNHILIKNLETGSVEVVTKDTNGNFYNGGSGGASFSPDGNSIIFSSLATNIVAVGNGRFGYPVGQVYVKNLLTGQVQLVSTNADGIQGDDGSSGYGFSPDGVHVLIGSYSHNFVPSPNNQYSNDIFLKNIVTGEIQRITSDANGNAGDYLINSNSEGPSFSADGRYVVFSSISSSLVPNDTNFSFDVFIKDIITGDIQRISTSQTNQLGGIDEVRSSVNYTLGNNIENLTLTGTAISGTGNNLDNIITGNASNNVLSGSAGNDTLAGGAGNDTLNGGLGNDTLIGGLGNDILIGGVGADSFVWALADKGTNGRPAIDKISDFNSTEDKLDLRDLLVGESSGNILNYLDITTSTIAGVTNTEIRISNHGGFVNGNYAASAENQHITLTGVNLLNGTNEASLLNNLISQNKLMIDA